ncbi:beta-lactamase family protein [Sphingomonas sp. R-74633]|uniref:serine hydrolase domain-containing protein n=1 Tax=Sphingomonas sp. R-74633 TaxID=2751188 RepID=UPI0015D21432|nr:serine hydrolase domain-containing protein [Sphingomonas sp. R-74633]NYT40313.1 beta-lactamase family protein [Sphingomonas sp. R-74633]
MDRVAPEQVGLTSEGLDAVDAAVQAQIDAGVVAGAVTLTLRHGKIARIRILGVDDVETGAPLAEDAIFRIFSMTKPVTATAMMILHDEGLWRPEDPVARHLPELAGLKVLEGDALVAPDHPPTMAELMTHRAGFGYGLTLGESKDRIEALYRDAGILQAPDLNEMVARLATVPLAHQPGTLWRYSLSMDVQGAIIERLSGQGLADFMRTRIFEPLGMTDTGFFVPPEKRHRLASLYFKPLEGPLEKWAVNPMRPDPDSEPGLAMGGAGLYSTALDYARYAQMLLNEGALDGRRIVSSAGVREQMTNCLPDALLETRFVAGHQKFRPGFGYGYNGVVFTDPELAGIPVGRGTYHWDGAAGTWFWVDPENDLAFVGMIQLLSYAAPPLQEMTQKLMAAAFS